MVISVTNCPDAFVVSPPESAKQLVRERLAVRRGYCRKKAYMVGCGKCEVCETERKERRAARWFSRLKALIQYFPEHPINMWRAGECFTMLH